MDKGKYVSIFLQEMRANLEQLSQMLIDLERDNNDIDLLQKIMRTAHSCKGACKMMKYTKTADLCHAMEDVFDGARHQKVTIDALATDLCLAALDEIEATLERVEKEGIEIEEVCLTTVLRDFLAGKEMDPAVLSSMKTKKEGNNDDALFTQIPSIRVDTEKLDDLLNIAGEISLLKLQMERSSTQDRDLLDQLARLSTNLTDKVIESRLVPLELVFSRFPRLIRDLAQTQKKQISFEMTGIDYELDKTLVDHLISPLIHILRNAVDHGIEMPEEREKLGKKAEGSIRLSLYQVEGFTVVSVTDDGAPIVLDDLKAIATKKGLPKDFLDTITEENILDLLCDPRFSSSETVTDISGRGVGMSVVRETVNNLGGRLELSLDPKKFTLMLPLQLSIIHALLVESGGDTYTLPFVHIQRLLRLGKQDCKVQLSTAGAVIDGQDVPLVSLHTALSTGDGTKPLDLDPNAAADVVLTHSQHGTVGIVVDRIVASRDVLVKPAPEMMEETELYSGSTILDTGAVSMIVDIPRVLTSVRNHYNEPST